MRSHKGLALLLLSLALTGCAAASGSVAPPASSSAGRAESPAPPRLLVRLNVGGGWAAAYGQHVADYLTDGTVIRLNGATMERNRLNEAGLASVRATLAKAADLLDTPMRIEPLATLIPADNFNMPEGIREALNTFMFERPDGSRYTVSAPSRRPGDRFASVRDPVVEGLTALADDLADPVALVGAAGFVDPAWNPYEPEKMVVFLTLQEMTDRTTFNDGVIPHIGPPDWPFESVPHRFGAVYKGPGDIVRRCAFLPSAEAGTAIASLSTGGGQRAAGLIASGYTWRSDVLIWVDGSQATFLGLQASALLPEDGGVSCLDALSY